MGCPRARDHAHPRTFQAVEITPVRYTAEREIDMMFKQGMPQVGERIRIEFTTPNGSEGRVGTFVKYERGCITVRQDDGVEYTTRPGTVTDWAYP